MRGDEAVPADLPAGEGEIGNTLQAYLREIRKAPLFTPQEEFAMATRARQGDFKARQLMIERNLRLVVSIAKHYLNRGLTLADLIESFKSKFNVTISAAPDPVSSLSIYRNGLLQKA